MATLHRDVGCVLMTQGAYLTLGLRGFMQRRVTWEKPQKNM